MVEILLREPVFRNLRPSILGFEAEVPKVLQIRNMPWEATSHADNRNLHCVLFMTTLRGGSFIGKGISIPIVQSDRHCYV